MGWKISERLEPIYVDDVEEVSMDCLMCDYYKHGKCTHDKAECYWDICWGCVEDFEKE